MKAKSIEISFRHPVSGGFMPILNQILLKVLDSDRDIKHTLEGDGSKIFYKPTVIEWVMDDDLTEICDEYDSIDMVHALQIIYNHLAYVKLIY